MSGKRPPPPRHPVLGGAMRCGIAGKGQGGYRKGGLAALEKSLAAAGKGGWCGEREIGSDGEGCGGGKGGLPPYLTTNRFVSRPAEVCTTTR